MNLGRKTDNWAELYNAANNVACYQICISFIQKKFSGL